MKRFFIDSFAYAGSISTDNIYKLISTTDNVVGDCYEIPSGLSRTQLINGSRVAEWKMIYSANDPYCDSEKLEYGFRIESDEYDEENEPCGRIIFVDLKTGEKKALTYSDVFELPRA